MKIRKLICLILPICLLSACDFKQNNSSGGDDNGEAGNVSTGTKLDTPNDISFSNNILTWNIVPNASRYGVKINSRNELQTEDVSFLVDDKIFSQEQDFYYSVRSIGDGVSFLDSDYSAPTKGHYVPSSDGGNVPDEKFIVRFLNFDNSILYTDEVAPGDTAIYRGEQPTKPKNNQYSYTFTGWDKDLRNVNSDFDTIAQYSESINSYTVRFLNYDSEVLYSQDVEYGKSAIYNGITPSRPSDSNYTYVFSGWDVDYSYITNDLDVHALFTRTEKGKGFYYKSGIGMRQDNKFVEYKYNQDTKEQLILYKVAEIDNMYVNTVGRAKINNGGTVFEMEYEETTSQTVSTSISSTVGWSLGIELKLSAYSAIELKGSFETSFSHSVDVTETINNTISISETHVETLPTDSTVGYSYRWAVCASFDVYELIRINPKPYIKKDERVVREYIYDLVGDPVITLQYCETSRFSYDEEFYNSFGLKELTNVDLLHLAGIDGNGDESDPFMLKQSIDFFALSIHNDKFFKLNNDIDFLDRAPDDSYNYGYFSGIDYFNGTLDGNNNAIRNLYIHGHNLSVSGSGLIHTLGENGVIKNIVFENCAGSFWNSSFYDPEYESFFSMGIIVGFNEGIVQNCSVSDTYLLVKITDSSNKNQYVGPILYYAGVLCGTNSGLLKNCNVSNSRVEVETHLTKLTTNSLYYTRAIAGGLVGKLVVNEQLESQVVSCSTTNIKATADIYYYPSKAGGATYNSIAVASGLIGCVNYSKDNLYSDCSVSNSTLSATVHKLSESWGNINVSTETGSTSSYIGYWGIW